MQVGDLVSIPDGRSGPLVEGLLIEIADNPSDSRMGMVYTRKIVRVLGTDGQIWTAWAHQARTREEVACKSEI